VSSLAVAVIVAFAPSRHNPPRHRPCAPYTLALALFAREWPTRKVRRKQRDDGNDDDNCGPTGHRSASRRNRYGLQQRRARCERSSPSTAQYYSRGLATPLLPLPPRICPASLAQFSSFTLLRPPHALERSGDTYRHQTSSSLPERTIRTQGSQKSR
jgi:hypothetical protein